MGWCWRRKYDEKCEFEFQFQCEGIEKAKLEPEERLECEGMEYQFLTLTLKLALTLLFVVRFKNM